MAQTLEHMHLHAHHAHLFGCPIRVPMHAHTQRSLEEDVANLQKALAMEEEGHRDCCSREEELRTELSSAHQASSLMAKTVQRWPALASQC